MAKLIKPNLRFSQVDPIESYNKRRKLLEIDKTAKKWSQVKNSFIQEEYRKRISIMKKRKKKIYWAIANNKQNWKAEENIDSILKTDDRIYSACKNYEDMEDINIILENMVFAERKRVNKLIFEINNTKEEFNKTKEEIRLMKSLHSKGGKTDGDKQLKIVQEKQSELESKKTEKEAGIIVLNSYKKLLIVLQNENKQFDTIVSRLKAMVIIRAQFALYLMELLKWATFDSKGIEEASKILKYIHSELAFKQCKELKNLKLEYVRIKDVPTNMKEIPRTSLSKFTNEEQQLRQYANTLEIISKQWEAAFNDIKQICGVEHDSEILSSVERILYQRDHSLNILEINNVLLNNLTKRRDYMKHILDELMYTQPKQLKEAYEEKEKLLKKQRGLKEKREKLKEELKYVSEETVPLFSTLLHFHHLLKNIASQPYETFRSNQEIYAQFDIIPGETDKTRSTEMDAVGEEKKKKALVLNPDIEPYDDDHFIISRRLRKEKYPDRGDPCFPVDEFVSELFDGILLKVKLILKQLGDDPKVLTEKASKKAMKAYTKYVQSVAFCNDEGMVIESDTEEEEDCEKKEKAELERVLMSVWLKGGSVG